MKKKVPSFDQMCKVAKCMMQGHDYKGKQSRIYGPIDYYECSKCETQVDENKKKCLRYGGPR